MRTAMPSESESIVPEWSIRGGGEAACGRPRQCLEHWPKMACQEISIFLLRFHKGSADSEWSKAHKWLWPEDYRHLPGIPRPQDELCQQNQDQSGKSRLASDSPRIKVGKVFVIKGIPDLGHLLNRGQNIRIVLQTQGKGYGFTVFDLGKKQVNRLRGGQSERTQNFFDSGLAARVDAGSQNGGLRHDTRRAQLCFSDKMNPTHR